MPATRFCVVGPGAVGGVLAAALHAGGADVSLLGRRGPHLAALQRAGLVLRTPDRADVVLPLPATADASEVGPVDVVVLAVKATALAAVAPVVQPLLDERTLLLPALNGVPWWFLHGIGGTLDGAALATTDPGGVLGRLLAPSRVLGCVVHLAASVPEPGVVLHASGRGLVVGDASRAGTGRVRAVADALSGGGQAAGGLDVTVADGPGAIRQQVWVKLLGNVSFNPVSVLTGATLEQIAGDPAVAALCARIIGETAAVGAALGVDVDISPPERIAMARRLGPVRTSMLQDADAGRPLELDALLGAVAELGHVLGVETPMTDTVLALMRLRAGPSRQLGTDLPT